MAMGRVWIEYTHTLPEKFAHEYPIINTRLSIPIPESYPNILSMDIHTLPETHLILFLIQNILM